MYITGLKTENLSSPAFTDSRNPRFCWHTEGDEYNIKQKDYRIIVSSDKEKISSNNGDMWDSGKIESDDSVYIIYKGKTLESTKTYYWRVAVTLNNGAEIVSDTAEFNMGMLDASDFKCGFIGIDTKYTVKSEEAGDKAGMPSPYLRRKFSISKEIKNAKLFATALGLYEMRINGKKVGSYEMTPGWTDYKKSLQYQGYNVTGLLNQGENALGAVLGDGWYCGNIAIVGRKQYGDYPLGLMAHLIIEYTDGTSESIVTDGNWKGTTGPIVYNDNQTGEYYDARKELTGFDTPDFDDSEWVNAINVKSKLDFKLKAAIGPQVQTQLTLKAVKLAVDKDGKYIYDMGQNMVGRISFKLKEKRGQKIIFRFGEMLNKDGTLYTENLRSALQNDVYIAKGDGIEYFEPKFTFHGFRYVEVTGLENSPSLEDITGVVFYSACEPSGVIETSDKMVNKLFSNQLWGQRGNFISVPTDCPQRDERMGWTGDAQVFARTACYNMSCAGFYEKYIQDCLEAQKENGAITDVVPCVQWENGSDLVGNGNAGWGDVIFVLPWTVYNMYGDIKILEDSYPAMCRYLKYLEETTNGYLRPDFGYGDWLSIGDDTPKDVMSTAFFAYAAKLTALTASVLYKEQESEKYNCLFDKIKKAFNDAYIDKDGIIKGDTQCCYVLALKMELVSEREKELAVKHLIRTIERKDWHLSTGFIGVSYLLPVLSENGYNDIAYRLLLNDTYPSWGYSIKNGATTIWERWNSYTEENGFGDVGMNSFNHYSLGSVGEWMYRYMGGINPLEPGFKKIKIKPFVNKRLNHAYAEYQSAYGIIKSRWSTEKDGILYDITVPANTTALICLNGEDIICIKGEAAVKEIKDGYKIYETGSGNYKFILQNERT